jgi:multicomponent Na+:H+ antiporter subunit A
VAGLLPGVTAYYLVEPAVAAVMGAPDTGGRLKLWAGFNLPLVLLSLVTFALGFVLYWFHQDLRAAGADRGARPRPRCRLGPDAGRLHGARQGQTRVIQTGVMRQYLFATFTVLALAILVPRCVTRNVGGVRLAFGGLELSRMGRRAS